MVYLPLAKDEVRLLVGRVEWGQNTSYFNLVTIKISEVFNRNVPFLRPFKVLKDEHSSFPFWYFIVYVFIGLFGKISR